jgi:hypothetical protein
MRWIRRRAQFGRNPGSLPELQEHGPDSDIAGLPHGDRMKRTDGDLYARLATVYEVSRERFRALMDEKPRSHAAFCENIAKIQTWKTAVLESSFGMREIERGSR